MRLTRYFSIMPMLAMAATGSFAKELNAHRVDLTFQDMRAASRDAEQAAEVLTLAGRQQQLGWQTHSLYLEQIRDDLNQIGKDLEVLESGQNTLPPARREALAAVAPLFRDAAGRVEHAIRNFNENPSRNAQFGLEADDTAKVVSDTSRATQVLRDFAAISKEQKRAARTGPPAS